MVKKLLALILALLMTVPSIISCSEETVDNETKPAESAAAAETGESVESTEETEAAGYLDELPEVTYDGYEYMIYSSNASSNTWFVTTYVDFEEDSAEVLESAIYRRNRLVEDRFDIEITEFYAEISEIKTALVGGDSTSDLNLHTGGQMFALAQEGYMFDQLKLDYLDFEKPYWDHNAAAELTIAGKLYHSAGDFMTTHFDVTRALFFNKGLIENYHLENPYELVKNNKWTYDTLQNMIVQVGEDLDGNGVYDHNDLYGILSYDLMINTYLLLAGGEKFVSKDENDLPYISFYNEKFLQIYDKVYNLVHVDGGIHFFDARGTENGSGLGDRAQEVMFPNNQALFWIECLAWSKALREMQLDFGILPAPKFDESQERHYHVTSGFYGFSIPTTVKDLDMTCIVLEALNSMSTGLIDVAYYENMLKSKISRDEESGDMLDIITDSILYDTSIIFNFATIDDGVSALIADGSTDVSSYYNRTAKVQNRLIAKSNEQIAALDH